jgi:chromate transporter
MKIVWQLFITFFKIGAFTLGGGYAMLSMVEKAVVDQKKWIASDEFWDLIAIVQSLPGVFAVNTALYVGHKIAGRKGAAAAMLGAIIPSIVIILLLATIFREYRDLPVVERIFKGIRPCVVALILAPSLRMIKSAKINWKTVIIPIATVALIWWLKVSPAWVILAAIAGSVIYAIVMERKMKPVESQVKPDADKEVKP